LSNSSQQKVIGFEKAGDLLRRSRPELLVSKQKLRQAEAIRLVRVNRESCNQNLGFASRPFVLCGLPIKRPPKSVLLHERRNGQFLLQLIGHPTYGVVPWGQDRLVPIFLATLAVRQQKQTITFRSAAEMLDVFGMQQGGSQYRRPIAAFQRVFGATIFFGTDTQSGVAAKGSERIPIFGDLGLASQLGSADYARPRKFRERLERWLDLVRVLWPSCPARITADGDRMLIQPASALTAKGA
jgi:hypothetical protein